MAHAVQRLPGRLLVDGDPCSDLATHPRDDHRPSWAVVDRILRDLRAYGRVFHQIPIDASHSPDTQQRITQLANDGERFVVHKLRHPVWERRMQDGDPTVTSAQRSLVRVERRLDETSYHAKLPTGVWRGRRQRVLRPARLLVGQLDPSGRPSRG